MSVGVRDYKIRKVTVSKQMAIDDMIEKPTNEEIFQRI